MNENEGFCGRGDITRKDALLCRNRREGKCREMVKNAGFHEEKTVTNPVKFNVHHVVHFAVWDCPFVAVKVETPRSRVRSFRR